MELEVRARAHPEDLDLCEELWSSLLDDEEYEDAAKVLARLVAALRGQPYRILRALTRHEACAGSAPGLVELRGELGLEFAHDTLSPDRAVEQLAARAPQLARMVRREELAGCDIRWVEGDLRVPHLDLCGQLPLVVTGSLYVAGALVDSAYPLSVLVVLGDLVAANVVTRGELAVGGSVRIAGLWFLNSGNDYEVRVAGNVRTGLFYEGGMHTAIGGSLEGPAVSRHNKVSTRDGELPHDEIDATHFLAHVLEDGEPNVERLVEAAELELPMLAPTDVG